MYHVPKDLCETHSLGPTTREWLVVGRQVPSFQYTRTIAAGHSDARHGYEFVRLRPAFSQILACMQGEGRVLIDGRWQPCPAGWAYITAPRSLCAYHVRPGGRWRVCWILYDEKTKLPSIEPGQPPRLVSMDATGLQLVIKGLCHEAGAQAEPATLDVWATLLHRLVLRLLQPGDSDPRLAQLWLAVRHDLAGDWSLARMARCAGMSAESLRRLCQRNFGRPPLAQLTHLRMQFAADLLSCTGEKVTTIASRVGYGDAFAFSNAFKRATGLPPSVYRVRQGRQTNG
jgi:AraC-like DNA-binding protein